MTIAGDGNTSHISTKEMQTLHVGGSGASSVELAVREEGAAHIDGN